MSSSTASRPRSPAPSSSRWPRRRSRRASSSSMPPHAKKRLAPEVFDLPVEKMRAGWYTDAYFNHARAALLADGRHPRVVEVRVRDRKSTRLNSSHLVISYAVFCLKKKTQH